jgi:hypothetical protein
MIEEVLLRRVLYGLLSSSEDFPVPAIFNPLLLVLAKFLLL